MTHLSFRKKTPWQVLIKAHNYTQCVYIMYRLGKWRCRCCSCHSILAANSYIISEDHIVGMSSASVCHHHLHCKRAFVKAVASPAAGFEVGILVYAVICISLQRWCNLHMGITQIWASILVISKMCKQTSTTIILLHWTESRDFLKNDCDQI